MSCQLQRLSFTHIGCDTFAPVPASWLSSHRMNWFYWFWAVWRRFPGIQPASHSRRLLNMHELLSVRFNQHTNKRAHPQQLSFIHRTNYAPVNHKVALRVFRVKWIECGRPRVLATDDECFRIENAWVNDWIIKWSADFVISAFWLFTHCFSTNLCAIGRINMLSQSWWIFPIPKCGHRICIDAENCRKQPNRNRSSNVGYHLGFYFSRFSTFGIIVLD